MIFNERKTRKKTIKVVLAGRYDERRAYVIIDDERYFSPQTLNVPPKTEIKIILNVNGSKKVILNGVEDLSSQGSIRQTYTFTATDDVRINSSIQTRAQRFEITMPYTG